MTNIHLIVYGVYLAMPTRAANLSRRHESVGMAVQEAYASSGPVKATADVV